MNKKSSSARWQMMIAVGCDPYWIRTNDLFPVKEAL